MDRARIDRVTLLHLARFAAVYVAAEFMLRTAAASGLLVELQNATAAAAAAILNVVGVGVTVSGSVITGSASTVNVSGYCVPTSALALTIALMLTATPGPLVRTVLWSGLGVMAVLLVNIFRVAVVGWLADTASPALEALHVNVLPVGLALAGLACWWVALRWERAHA